MTKLAAIGSRRAMCLLLAAVTIVAMMMAMLVPGTAKAALEGTTGGSFTTNDSSSAPLVNSVGLYYAENNTSCTTMDPTVERWIKVSVTDNQTLEHLTSVKITIWYDAAGTHTPVPTAVDNETCAIITWTRTDNWTLTSMGAGTTWTSHAGDTPTLVAQNTGTFVFHFVPGKVATENTGSDDWDVTAVATDAASGSDDASLTALDMNWYGEISGVSPSVDFGSVSLGAQDMSGALNAKYISNGNYSEQARTVGQWANGGYNANLQTTGAPGDGEFTLWVNDESDTAGEFQLTASYIDIDNNEVITTEDGVTNNNIHLWLTLGSSGIVSGTYTGNIYFAISNR